MDAVVRESLLPNLRIQLKFSLRSERESALNELKRFFQGDFRGWCDQKMEVIRHDHEFVKQEAALLTVVAKDVEEEVSHALGLQKGAASVSDGGNKEGSGGQIVG